MKNKPSDYCATADALKAEFGDSFDFDPDKFEKHCLVCRRGGPWAEPDASPPIRRIPQGLDRRLAGGPSAAATQIKLHAVEAQMQAMQASLREVTNKMAAVVEQHTAAARIREQAEKARLEAICKMTEGLFGASVTTTMVNDPGEEPYAVVVVPAGNGLDPVKAVALHLEWHDKLVSIAPDAVGLIRLSITFE